MDVITAANLKSLDLSHYGTAFNVQNDLQAIGFEAWDPNPSWMLLPGLSESDDWRAQHFRLGARSPECSSISYLFEFARDMVTGAIADGPTLRVSYELEDNFKPDSEEIEVFSGLQAAQLFEIVSRKFPGLSITRPADDLSAEKM